VSDYYCVRGFRPINGIRGRPVICSGGLDSNMTKGELLVSLCFNNYDNNMILYVLLCYECVNIATL
jgi:hypothetical protein